MRNLIGAILISIGVQPIPKATAQPLAEVAYKSLACTQVTGHATRALRYVMEGQPYVLYYATTLARQDISDYQRWVLDGLFKGLEEAQLTPEEALDFAELWMAYCLTVIGQGKLELSENRQYKGE